MSQQLKALTMERRIAAARLATLAGAIAPAPPAVPEKKVKKKPAEVAATPISVVPA